MPITTSTSKQNCSFTEQEQIVLCHLFQSHSVSTNTLKELGIASPSAIVYKLRSKGFRIGKHYFKPAIIPSRAIQKGHWRYKILVGLAVTGGAQ